MNYKNYIEKALCAIAILIAMALPCFQAEAQSATPEQHPNAMRPDYTVSLITCYPGSEIYELCGHSAIRVRGEGIDSVWNYGIFDFSQPNFVYRFVKGETDYKGASYPFKWFLPEYVATGRKVVEQDINFTPEEARHMLEMLRTSVLPENAVYRYNYTKDNCSTRILSQIDSASTEKIIYPDSARFGTYRNAMRAYHEGYPWYQFGIDVALGSGLDEKIGTRQEMFVPMELMQNASEAHFADGRPLVKKTRVLNTGTDNAVLPPTPWWLGPIFWGWLLAVIIGLAVARNLISGRLFLPLYLVWFFILALSGCLVAFLVFISVHEATSPNLLILWLNPFQILFPIALYIRTLRPLARVMAYYNIVVPTFLIMGYPFYAQSFNPAFFPLLLATVALSISYAIIGDKSSYNKR